MGDLPAENTLPETETATVGRGKSARRLTQSPGDADAKSVAGSPEQLRGRLERLRGRQLSDRCRLDQLNSRMEELDRFLETSPGVTAALDTLSEQLFRRELDVLEDKLTLALDEVLGQQLKFRSAVKMRSGQATIDFFIERDGNREDIQKGQGGSVQNILSVGLRFFALANLDKEKHRRFVVLDEQDCWLQPEVVPRLMKVIDAVVRELGFQIVVISHHDISLFERYADRIYRFQPVRRENGASTVEVIEVKNGRE